MGTEIEFLDAVYPQEIRQWGNSVKYKDYALWIRVVTRYLKIYPLVLACSFVNQSENVPFKQEYILPQMLIQWVQRNKQTVQGIEYSSCVESILKDNGWNANNVVIPAIPPYDEKQYRPKSENH